MGKMAGFEMVKKLFFNFPWRGWCRKEQYVTDELAIRLYFVAETLEMFLF